MSRRCKLTGKGPKVGNNVSHAHNKTKRRQLPNLQTKRIFVPELGRSIRMKLSTSAMRTIDSVGLMAYLRKHNLQLKDVI